MMTRPNNNKIRSLPPVAAMVRPLGDADHDDILYAHFLQHGAGGR